MWSETQMWKCGVSRWQQSLSGSSQSVLTDLVTFVTQLDARGHSNPMSYMGADGRQYVMIVSSGINAFALE